MKNSESPSIMELKEVCLKEKEDFIVTYFYRVISIRLTKLLIKTNITPNQITTLSFLLCLFSAIFFMIGEYKYLVIGVLLYNISFIFDNSDGEVARYKKQSSELGGWLDTIYDILGTVFVFTSLTIGLYFLTKNVNILISGFFATVNILIMYVFILRKRKDAEIKWVKEHHEFGFMKRFFIGSRSAIAVTLTLAALFNQIYYFLLFWSIVGFLIWVKQYFSNYNLFKSL